MSKNLQALAGAVVCIFLADPPSSPPMSRSRLRSIPRTRARRSTATSLASSPNTWAAACTRESGSGPTPPIPNTRGIRNDVVAALKAIKVPNVRWPGGCFADEYHWRNGIGPRDRRPATLNPNWGGVIEPNTFGTHEFMDFVQQIGADAYLSINVGSGTPAEAADWLEYLTTPQPSALGKQRAANGHPEPYAVPMLGIGNEAWGCGGSMTPDYYVSQLKVYARYARNYNTAQKMQRIAVGPDSADTGYTKAVMEAWKNKVWAWDIEGISLHFYTVVKWPPAFKATGFGEDEYAALLDDTRRMNDCCARTAPIMDQYDPEKKIALVVDEWGAWLATTPGQPRRIPGAAEQPARRAHRRAEHQHLSLAMPSACAAPTSRRWSTSCRR